MRNENTVVAGRTARHSAGGGGGDDYDAPAQARTIARTGR